MKITDKLMLGFITLMMVIWLGVLTHHKAELREDIVVLQQASILTVETDILEVGVGWVEERVELRQVVQMLLDNLHLRLKYIPPEEVRGRVELVPADVAMGSEDFPKRWWVEPIDPDNWPSAYEKGDVVMRLSDGVIMILRGLQDVQEWGRKREGWTKPLGSE